MKVFDANNSRELLYEHHAFCDGLIVCNQTIDINTT